MILFVGGVTAGIVSLFSDRATRSISPPPPPQAIARMPSHRLQDYAAENAIVLGAQAGDKALVSLRGERDHTVPVSVSNDRPGENSRPGANERPDANPRVPVATLDRGADSEKPRSAAPAIRLQRVRSTDPHPTRDRAMTDALAVARDRLVLELRLQEPPITAVPTLDQIRADYVRPDSIVEIHPTPEQRADWTSASLEPNRVWIELDVEVSDEQLRHLRAADRFDLAGLGVGAVLIVVLALHGFLRLDAWTKGYLTWGLAIAAAAVGGAGIGTLLFLVRSQGG